MESVSRIRPRYTAYPAETSTTRTTKISTMVIENSPMIRLTLAGLYHFPPCLGAGTADQGGQFADMSDRFEPETGPFRLGPGRNDGRLESQLCGLLEARLGSRGQPHITREADLPEDDTVSGHRPPAQR